MTCLLVLAAVVVYTLAWLPIEITIDKFLYEDLYYYLKIARNIVHGHGVTFDGFEPTNGFHPLWMAVSVAVEALFSSDLAVHVLLSVSATLHVLQGYLLFRIVRNDVPELVALFVTALFLFNYRIIAVNLCGLETPLAGVLLLLVIHYLYFRFSESTRMLRISDYLVLGLLLGIATLARFDLGLFAFFATSAALLMPLVADIRTTPNCGRSLGVVCFRGCATVIAYLLCLAPWFLWSTYHVGALLPESRRAIALLSNDATFNLGSRFFSSLWWLTDTANAMSLWPVVEPKSLVNYVGILPISLFTIVMVLAVLAQRKLETRLLLGILWAYAVCHLAYYGMFVRAEIRYLMPFVIVFYVGLGFCAGGLSELSPPRRKWLQSLVALVLTFNLITSSVQAWQENQAATRTHEDHSDLLRMAVWIRDHLPSNAMIGAWNAGIIGYYSQKHVVNLDGVVNSAIIDVNADRRLASYLEARSISYLVDLESQMNAKAVRFGLPVDWRRDYREIHRIGKVVLLQRRAGCYQPRRSGVRRVCAPFAAAMRAR